MAHDRITFAGIEAPVSDWCDVPALLVTAAIASGSPWPIETKS
ncbi:hypothetical protein ACIGDI_03870 [Streptomyces sp. NPDC085900]